MSWQSPNTAVRAQNERPQLPPGYVTVQDILAGRVGQNRMTNVAGLVKDFRAPFLTRKFSDWKCTLTIYDKSTEDDGSGLSVMIFKPNEEDMPQPSAGDVVLLNQIKVQGFRNELSLLTSFNSVIHVYTASKIPKPPRGAVVALQEPLRPPRRAPSDKEHEYVSHLYHSIDKGAIPEAEEFSRLTELSRNVKGKFSLLKDVHEDRFCDIIAQVVKDPFDLMDKTTLWVSDYTENSKFYKYSWDGSDMPAGREGDPYGYTTTKLSTSSSWSGPFGKRSMQITCFEPHSTYVQSDVKANHWVKIRNLQIKYGHNANNLEGFIREDRAAFSSASERRIDILDTTDAENIDDRLKDAIRRKRDYDKTVKEQKKKFAANEGGAAAGTKRKADQTAPGKKNRKQRRAEGLLAAQKKVEEHEIKQEENLGLNKLIKCESLDQPIFTLASILEPVPYTMTIDGKEIQTTLPFTNAKYRANVRVVDFRPRKLEDFAAWRKNNEYDILSDYSGGSDSDSDDDPGTLDRYTGDKIWEWRFSLQLEEAGKLAKGSKPERLWAVVNNIEGQQLLNLDANDLRANPTDLTSLRKTLFELWGNLEEVKAKEYGLELNSRRRLAGNLPPPDSSDDEDTRAGKDATLNPPVEKVSNNAFTCCLKQYGAKMKERNPKKMNAGEGYRWERTFGLFGTAIKLA
ncbi:uncharacterized protein BCR38DRAFT_454245 [Pseudomassariella vexata]|uniref:Protection of telomeres protein 1 n=1 Tax=Pseudomassariella vexata TaxID=1141098 RepID=A0A1Y2EJT1_9PEZI|nr:uncharacterized protein BCR38DRAFT_454245 [Pseudomassariella vexata]ORY71823.1 hypothetical protein BCR38DRAFT_454245 [Pseudomassariella vexata]